MTGEIIMTKKHTVQQHAFKYSLIASAIVGMSSFSAYTAEQTDKKNNKKDAEVEVIEVKGQRGNLISAQNMKMNADTVLDAISSEDMGSLPDRSVLEAISRLPGVAIERFAAANDPDHFGVEGGGVVVRGLTHVRSEFNNRDTFSADSGRGLSFEDVSPELMGSVEVYKNQTADMIEGGIAGTVNLNTRKAFDADGSVFAFSVDTTYTDMRDKTSPTFSALFSDIWETDAGRFGLLANYSNSELKVRSDGVQAGLYNAQSRDNNIFIPRSTRLSRKEDDRTRQGMALSLQWENPDKTMLVTGEFIRSDAELSWGENVIEMDDGDSNASMYPVQGTEFEFDNKGIFQKGIITSEAGWRGDGSDSRTGMQHTMQTRIRDEQSIVNDYSMNVKYTPNDSLSFQFDVQYVDATMEIFDVSVMGAQRMVVGMDLTGDDVPIIDIYGKSFDNQADYLPGNMADPSLNFFRSAMDHVSDNEGEEFSSRFDMEYTFDSGMVKSMEVGVRYADREQTTRQSDYNWGLLSEAWSGNGNAWYSDNPDIPVEAVSFDNFARGGVLNVEGGNSFLFPDMGMVRDYRNLEAALSPLLDEEWSALASRDGANGDFVGNEVNQTDETNTAFYIKLNFEGDIADMDYSANVGLRYVKLENETYGFLSFPDDLADPTNANDSNNYLPADQQAFGNAAAYEEKASSEYSNILPSINFKLNLSDELLLRFGFSEAIAKPSLGYLRNYVNIGGKDLNITYPPGTDPSDPDAIPESAAYGRYTGSSGNPYLKPMESYNYDLSLEYYFAEAGSLTLSYFYKDLSNYFINGTAVREYTNNGSTQSVAVAGPTNGDEGTIEGFEVAYQQFFDQLPGVFSGLGVQANYTYIDEDGSPNANLEDDKPDSAAGEQEINNVPLEGLSKDNYNFALLYEKYDVSARIAYNWRSEYLLTTRDVITTLPIWNEAGGQLDASIFYNINEEWQMGLQGTNLNNNVTDTSMQINNERDRIGRSWFTSDRRYSFIIKGTF
jgi:TonB-dependent receptor